MHLNRLYPFRYFLCVIIFSIANLYGYFFYLRDDLLKRELLNQKIGALHKQNEIAFKNNRQGKIEKIPALKKLPFDTRILLVFQNIFLRTGLAIEEVQFLTTDIASNPKSMMIHLKTQGSFLKVRQLLLLFIASPVEIQQLDLHLNDQGQLELNLDLIFFDVEPMRGLQKVREEDIKNNPFCLQVRPANKKALSLDAVSISQIFLLGHAEYAGEMTAILKLPDGSIRKIKKGSLVGVERAKLVEIRAHDVLLSFPDHHEEYLAS